MVFLYTLKRIDYKIVHLTLSFITTSGSKNEKQNRMRFLDVRIIREDKTFTTSVYSNFTFSEIYTHLIAFYHIPISLVLFTYTLIDDASEYAQVGPNYTLN